MTFGRLVHLPGDNKSQSDEKEKEEAEEEEPVDPKAE